MAREARRVRKDWKHPKDGSGRYVPLFDGTVFAKNTASWDEAARKWREGFCSDYKGGWVPLTDDQKAQSYGSWDGERPDPGDYMPLWKDDERTHLMMYENSTPGTPISPAFPTAEELARWLVDHDAHWFDDLTTSYEVWLAIIEDPINSAAIIVPAGSR